MPSRPGEFHLKPLTACSPAEIINVLNDGELAAGERGRAGKPRVLSGVPGWIAGSLDAKGLLAPQRILDLCSFRSLKPRLVVDFGGELLMTQGKLEG
jgi:hypothetical protein